MTNRTQVALEKNSVEPCYTAHDAVSVPLHKSLHDAPPIESANPIMKATVMGRLFYLVAALLRCASAASDSTQPSLHLSTTDSLNRVRCKRLFFMCGAGLTT